tara:strand:+ start:435 stop:611 length:177 start_codon:yes stop_codon:yes gene_type:complete
MSKYKVDYVDWEDGDGNIGTSFVVVLKACTRDEAEAELEKLVASAQAEKKPLDAPSMY